MSELNWFSAKIRMACLIEPKGGHRYGDSVFLFQSTDFDSAFKKALEIGRQHEETYLNAEEQRVMWKLKEIISLDIIISKSLDGAEVYSEPVDLLPGESIPFNIKFHPEQSTPTQTV